MNKMRGVLVGNAKGLSVHSSLLIDIDGFLWFFSVDETLFSLGIVASFKVESSLLEENFVYTLRQVLTGNLQS